MQKRKFGKIGWDISEISLGCWAMGADWVMFLKKMQKIF